eukprot:TRINITY_DN16198_c2_g1_i1.p2 TRINITY_DN16198_c2_g1~~TRINITY_DN16198_c2_g1_i1.p2  ORF type:complete len:449 (-),score=77.29 TRINITY_DN16198_c2_g1_i1:310-1581(-)
MARKKIREYDSKRLLRQYFERLSGTELPIQSVQVTQSSDFVTLLNENAWMRTAKLVVKPDMLFGQRGKHDLLGLDLTFTEAENFVRERMNRQVEVRGCKGLVNTFLIEPFVPHSSEYYLSITSQKDGNLVIFSDQGGVEIEENWSNVKQVLVPTLKRINGEVLAPLFSSLPIEVKTVIESFLIGCYRVFEELDFTLMEMNPFVVEGGVAFPLDMRGELDDTAGFVSGKKWGDLEFPQPFGRVMSSSEEYVHELDEKTGASLKLSILNPKGRIWTMVAGGGASVIYADTVGDLGMAHELGNYAEYSGGPNTQETYQFARTLLDCATAETDGRGKALLVGGGIANFTDVAATFKGIIQAMREKQDFMKACKMRVYVRRGGPNYQQGLQEMKALGEEIQIPFEVFGPEASMTGICKKAIDYIQSFD